MLRRGRRLGDSGAERSDESNDNKGSKVKVGVGVGVGHVEDDTESANSDTSNAGGSDGRVTSKFSLSRLPLHYAVLFLIFLFPVLWTLKHHYDSDNALHTIIIDAGSTGSRLFIYKRDGNGGVKRLGTKKTTPGLSDFASGGATAKYKNSSSQYMKLFRYANTIVPPSNRGGSRVRILATAGMRLFPETVQQDVYTSLRRGLEMEDEFEYRIEEIGTLGGEMEGYYGAIAINYLMGRVGRGMVKKGGLGALGSMDMGGSSTQIVFEIGNSSDKVRMEDFWVKSYLGYGADTMRERVWDKIVERGATSGLLSMIWGGAHVLENPCVFRGWEVKWGGKILRGTGDAETCRGIILDIMKERAGPVEGDREGVESRLNLDGVAMPRVRGDFMAMSLYFFAGDCLREVTDDKHGFVRNWPRPNMNEMFAAAKQFCSLEWSSLLPSQSTLHVYTRAEGLPHRCFEVIYISTILTKGFGLDENGRNVTFAYDIGGREGEWTMGMAAVEALQE